MNMTILYRWLIRPILFRLEPERAHRLTIALLKILQKWIELKYLVLITMAVCSLYLQDKAKMLRNREKVVALLWSTIWLVITAVALAGTFVVFLVHSW